MFIPCTFLYNFCAIGYNISSPFAHRRERKHRTNPAQRDFVPFLSPFLNDNGYPHEPDWR